MAWSRASIRKQHPHSDNAARNRMLYIDLNFILQKPVPEELSLARAI